MKLRYAAIVPLFVITVSAISVFAPCVADATDNAPTVTFEDGQIRPESVAVAAGRAFQLKVVNVGKSPD